MPPRPTRSLKHEYERFVEREIETYKESLPRHVLLGLGDEAAAVLAGELQLALTELLLAEEVDRIIFRRLRLPSYSTWRRRRMKELVELRRPERWGLAPDGVLVREVRPVAEGHVLVAGARSDGSALYLAAHGCDVTAVAEEYDVVQRVMDAADAAGLTERVRPLVGGLGDWEPDLMLDAVICTPGALSGLSPADRARTIQQLQSATSAGGVHLLQSGTSDGKVWLDELRRSYRGWQVSIEREAAESSLVARKTLSS